MIFGFRVFQGRQSIGHMWSNVNGDFQIFIIFPHNFLAILPIPNFKKKKKDTIY